MGFLDLLFNTQQNCINESILPLVAKQEIMSARLPHLNTEKIFLKEGEFCAYIDKAILNVKVKKRITKHVGSSSPGLLKGQRIHHGTGTSQEYTEVKQQKGILYITNKRVVFQATENGFEKLHRYLSTIEPYFNAVVLQYGKTTYELIVADGSIVNQVLKLINHK